MHPLSRMTTLTTQSRGGLRRHLSMDRENVNCHFSWSFSILFSWWPRWVRICKCGQKCRQWLELFHFLDTFCWSWKCLCNRQNHFKSILSSFMDYKWTLNCSNFSWFVPDFTKNPWSNVVGHGFLSLFVLWQFMVTLTQKPQNLFESL